MQLIVGLGNPGEKYKNTRHNTGFLVVDELEKIKLPGVVLFKPQKFMNRSGQEVKKWLKNRKVPYLPNLYVIHDDLDIPLGKFKISQKGPKIHNGLKSIYEQIGTRRRQGSGGQVKDFWHVRIGIDNRGETGFKGTGEEYVLENWRRQEKEIIIRVIKEVIDALKTAKVII